ncbi:MAG: filamentous hemagglutinin N-terminal domain-containing protein, partial [Gammaproteobacteria bacterium]
MYRSLIRVRRRGGQLLTFCYVLTASAVAGANPRGADVVHGSASFAMPNAHTLEITNSPSAVLNWQSFSIGAGETTRFIQESAASAVLNRVVGGSSSEILGNLLSNGRVFLINEAGILIGRDAMVDTAGLVLSTLDIDDADFLGGRLQFAGDASNGGITNHGYIKTAPGGEIILIAPRIVNEAQPGNPVSGLIESPEGELVLAAGTAITIASLDHPDITFEVSAPEHEVVNLGRLLAAGGSVSVLAGTLHHSGEINADAITRDSAGNVVLAARGDIYLDSGSRVSASGDGVAGAVAVTAGSAGGDGRLYALGAIAADGDTGGTVTLAADRVLATGAVSAHGVVDGGEVAVTATTEIIATASARLDAAGDSGAGGRVAVDGGTNTFSSALLVADGLTGGDVEVLGDEITLASATIDASGQAGGGRVRVGGGFQGGEDLRAAHNVTANASSVIKADAGAAGDGGSVVVWADGTTRFDGIVSAHGGAAAGDGGMVEVSGKDALAFAGRVDVGAPQGAAGTLLLDPKNIVFSDEAQGAGSFQLLDPHPGAGNNFGQTLQTFFEGGDFSTPAKIAVFDPLDDFGGADAGAVYLYRASDGALLSAFTGSHAGDGVGSVTLQSVAGVQVLRTPTWNSDRGAVTVFDVVNGINGAVTASNSLVGASAGDEVGLVSGLFSGVQSLGTTIAVRSSSFNADRGALTVAA